MEDLLIQSENLIKRVSLNFKRYLHKQVNWNERLIGIKGARGTGKTTMLLQWLHEKKLPPAQAAYFSLDELYFTHNTLVNTIKTFYQQGGKFLVLDEVHKYEDWSREIKIIYDRYADLQIVFSGSSIIDISRQESDLSRRAMMYELQGLSYREYLELEHNLKLPLLTLQQITDKQTAIRELFPEDFKPLAFFKEYLRTGYYPFFKEYKDTFHNRLQQVVRTIVEFDMAELRDFDIRNAKKMLQLVYIIAQQVPFKPNLSSLAEKTNIHRNTIRNYLHFLEQARLISLLYPAGTSVSTLQKPEKIFLNNTNLLFALSEEQPSMGTVREVFFNSQLNVKHLVNQTSEVDFEVDKKYLFEVGGKNKSGRQIINSPGARLVKDDLEYSAGNSIPLWVFGFLY